MYTWHITVRDPIGIQGWVSINIGLKCSQKPIFFHLFQFIYLFNFYIGFHYFIQLVSFFYPIFWVPIFNTLYSIAIKNFNLLILFYFGFHIILFNLSRFFPIPIYRVPTFYPIFWIPIFNTLYSIEMKTRLDQLPLDIVR
jgi:hypothetical protein